MARPEIDEVIFRLAEDGRVEGPDLPGLRVNLEVCLGESMTVVSMVN